MSKPFSIQAPEQIAKEYAGNKQKIAQAAQMGLVDPTAAVLAGMFIDRMRSAQVMEAAQQPTVAQQVLGGGGLPQPPVNASPGLGAVTPTPSPPPMMGAPMGAPAPAPAPAPQAPMGMAMGGLAGLSVPDTMFDEPSNGGYSGGGLVAFADAGLVDADAETNQKDEEELEAATGDIVASSRKVPKPTTKYLPGTMFTAPEMLGGLKSGFLENFDLFGEAAPRETKRAKELEAVLEAERSPEARKKRKKEDMWMTLAQIGSTMATTPGSLLEAAGAGIKAALPGAAAAAKERRGEERAITKELLAEERLANKEVEARAAIALDMLKGYNTIEQAFQDRNFNNMLTRLGIDADVVKARIMAGASVQGAMLAASASRYGSDMQYKGERERSQAAARQMVADLVGPGGPNYGQYMKAVRAGEGNLFLRDMLEAITGDNAPTLSGDDPLGLRR